ncbi:MAG: cytochrome c [Bacteroidia bacterium]|nr:cytochrome c [Bacteroidia bacterium]
MKTGLQSIQKNLFESHKILIMLVLTFLMLSISTVSFGQNGEEIFTKNCASCHKIGGGRLVGPDLLGVTALRSADWLLKWTKSSQTLIKSGDPDAKAISDEFGGLIMPDQALSDNDIKAIFTFIASKGGYTGADAQIASVASNESDNATEADIQKGKFIFEGIQRLSNHGPACISCHNINYKGVLEGGLLAKDLTDVFSRIGGDAGLKGILGAPPFPAMTESYKDHPMTDEEIGYIVAFLNKVDKDKANQVASSFNPLLYGGSGGIIGLLLIYWILWYGRKKYTVKREIFNRQIESI